MNTGSSDVPRQRIGGRQIADGLPLPIGQCFGG